MVTEEFNSIAQQASDMIVSRLIRKGKEYSSNGDRLANFKIQGRMYNQTPLQSLFGNLGKHQAWLEDAANNENAVISDDMIWEHIGDIICYYVLLIGLIKERNKILLNCEDSNVKEDN